MIAPPESSISAVVKYLPRSIDEAFTKNIKPRGKLIISSNRLIIVLGER
jgi:hypothetical protein